MAQAQKVIVYGGSGTGVAIAEALAHNITVRSITLSPRQSEIWILCKSEDGTRTERVPIHQENSKICSAISGEEESELFKNKEISDIFGEGGQIFAVDKHGQVYGWGLNAHGQLGVDASFVVSVPVCLPLSTKEMVAQIACGESHTLILTKSGKLYTMGDNIYGQLGLDVKQDERKAKCEPSCVELLQDVPISQVAAGKWHSVCVTISGRVFSWGRNNFGQLGLGTTSDECTPKRMKDFIKPVAYISAGDHHNAILTRAGELFTYGLCADGQLGHGVECKNELLPRMVEELEGSEVTQVACGKCHTVAYVPGCEKIFTFGCNTDGQLGFDCTTEKIAEPTMMSNFCGDQTSKIEKIFACGNHTYIVLNSTSGRLPSDFRHIECHRRILTLDEISKLLYTVKDDGDEDSIIKQLQLVMGSISCLNGSFLTRDNRMINENFHGIDFAVAQSAIKRISHTGNLEMIEAMLEVLSKVLLPSLRLRKDNRDIETLRIYSVLPVCFHIFLEDWLQTLPQPQSSEIVHQLLTSVVFVFFEIFLELFSYPMAIVKKWYAHFSSEEFLLLIKLCTRVTEEVLHKHAAEQSAICLPLKFLKLLEEINRRSKTVNFKEFYILSLSPRLLEVHFDHWKRKENPESVLCSYPFVLDAKAKNILLQVSTVRRREFLPGLSVLKNSLTIDRNNLVSGAMTQINRFQSLKLPLEVHFSGEVGMDYGALRKEFFMLAFKEILDPSSGLFTEYEDSNLLWFAEHQPESDSLYNFIGKLCGLSLHNNVVAYLNFPLALYKKLLGIEPNLDDLKELNPQVGSSLGQLLDFAEDEDMTVEEAFGFMFTTPDGMALKKGGEDIPVTVENRDEYVCLCVNYVFRESVKLQFEAFCSGFLNACEGEMLRLFRPEELMEMVVGVQDYDWDELKRNTNYKPLNCETGGFGVLHPTIIWFWEILRGMSPQEKLKFLLFLTGSDKIPLTGLQMTIKQREECDEFLPFAEVCFNSLHLHSYSSKEILEERLKLSIQCTEYHML